jgi:hypothetical protein
MGGIMMKVGDRVRIAVAGREIAAHVSYAPSELAAYVEFDESISVPCKGGVMIMCGLPLRRDGERWIDVLTGAEVDVQVEDGGAPS